MLTFNCIKYSKAFHMIYLLNIHIHTDLRLSFINSSGSIAERSLRLSWCSVLQVHNDQNWGWIHHAHSRQTLTRVPGAKENDRAGERPVCHRRSSGSRYNRALGQRNSSVRQAGPALERQSEGLVRQLQRQPNGRLPDAFWRHHRGVGPDIRRLLEATIILSRCAGSCGKFSLVCAVGSTN